MEWIETPESSNINRFRYDDPNKVLTVEFKNGGTYSYFDVPVPVFEQFKSSLSKGQFLAQQIKGVYRYART